MCLGAREPRSKRDPNTPGSGTSGGCILCTSFVQMQLRLFPHPWWVPNSMCGRGSAEVPRKRPGEPVSVWGCSRGPNQAALLGSDALALPNLTSCCKAAVHKSQHTFQPL